MYYTNLDYDLSWSPNKKADAPTLIKHVRKDVLKHMEFISTNMQKMDNVLTALNNGDSTLRNTLCKDCRHAIRSKRSQIHGGNGPSHKKRPLKMLPPERLHIVTEITNMLIQLERSTSENKEEEYCTQEEYYQEEIMETKQRYQEELDKLRLEMDNMKKEMNVQQDEKEKALKKSTTETEDLKRRNEELTRKLKSSDQKEKELSSLKNEHLRMKKNLESIELENKKLKKENERKDEELKWNRRPSSGYRKSDNDPDMKRLNEEREKVRKANTEIENLKSKCKDQLRKCQELEKDKMEIEEKNLSLLNDISKKNEEMKSMANQIKELQKQHRKELVLGLCKERSGMGKAMVDMITRELQRRVGGLLDGDNTNLTIKQCTGTSDIPNGPLIVLCLNMSRIGTNIQDALGEIQSDKNVFVMVLHHTSKDNLSSLTPTSLRVTGSELRQLGGIIDMAFSSDSGLYDCDLNNNAIDKITSIMRKY
ncbi:golgin subfamily A member 6-like protein 25 [Argopecten irradians]|uniref:golgin subfamily A member 6-like protein 25 n=1 Tax=Argopecten irradians TaxID=31199 RepID=UPI003724846A